ncbi:MAG: master DNA invertase Mpi family serine-type recombinase [Endomicrobium sp.]|nr:master DNA invertase Mpi family serine-type recombinase [Endomicrobium sp.]
MFYGYIRVSTDKQNMENQRFEIEKFAKDRNIIIDEWLSETISAGKALEKRKFGKLMKRLKNGDTVISTELSRFGRNLMQVMGILDFCMNTGVRILTAKEKYELGDNINAKVLAFAFGLSAEIERNLISQRTKEALQRIRAEGKILGRPKGRKNTSLKLTNKREYIGDLLKKHKSKSAIARKLKVHRTTLSNFIKSNIFF